MSKSSWIRISTFLIFLLCVQYVLDAQHCLSGIVRFADPDQSSTEISLVALYKNSKGEIIESETIARSPIRSDGFFHIQCEALPDTPWMRFEFSRMKYHEGIKASENLYQIFILSDQDTLRWIENGEIHASFFTDVNTANSWSRWLQFEQSHNPGQWSDQRAEKTRTYLQDSVETLWVKLAALKTLEDKDLLDTDIIRQPNYYLQLLAELRNSDIEAKHYAFIENKSSLQTLQKLKRQKYWSLALNGCLVITVFLLISRLNVIRRKRNSSQSLTSQEGKVRDLIIQGLTNKEIANQLHISVSTVKSHISHIYQKEGVRNRKSLIRKNQ